MSSPLRRSEPSHSSTRSSPSRNGMRANVHHRHSMRDSPEPSNRLLEDFGRMAVLEDRRYKDALDEQTAEQQKLHIEALDRALAKHERVRESAERTRERIELEWERDRLRREAEEKAKVEAARRAIEQERLETQRKELEAAKAREEEANAKRALENERQEAQRKAEAQRQQEEQRMVEKATQEKEEADRKAREQAEAHEKELQAQKEKEKASEQPNGVSPAAPRAPPPSQSEASQPELEGLVSTAQEREDVHKRYLEIHARLKHLRTHVMEEIKKWPDLKNAVSNWRRSVSQFIGQLAKTGPEAKKANSETMKKMVALFDDVSQRQQPTVDINEYFLTPPSLPSDNTSQFPAILLFLLNQFAKGIVRQLVSETSLDGLTAEPLGIFAVTIFARPVYLFQGHSLIDLLWAKYHKECPALFGIYGSEQNKAGRTRLGWKIDGDTFIPSSDHYERMGGLASGYSAITLRDFAKSKNSNPAPNRIWWETAARILNTSANDVQPTHFVLLKSLIQNSVPRVTGFFGLAGVALLRTALKKFPQEKGAKDDKGNLSTQVRSLISLGDKLRMEKALDL